MPDRELDVRREPHMRRHALILGAYSKLAPGEGFELVNDHDPKPLYYHFKTQFAGDFTWDYLQRGPEAWRVRIGRRGEEGETAGQPATSAAAAAGSEAAPATPREIQMMVAHHEQLSSQLDRLTDALTYAVAHRDDYAPHRAGLHEFVAGEVIPHALAEEDAIYAEGSKVATLAPLVKGMLMEHETLVALAEVIQGAQEPTAVSGAASAFRGLFEVHVRKENELLLPALVAGGTDPAALLSSMHAAFARRRQEAHGGGEVDTEGVTPKDGEAVVDTRVHDSGSCANLAMDSVDSLKPGESFLLVADHDPRGIHYMLDAERPGKTTWELVEDGPQRWQARVAAPAQS